MKRADLTRLPPRALEVVARVMATGDEKYAPGDWIDRDSRDDVRAILGHVNSWLAGVDCDAETGEIGLAHAAARLLMVLEREALGMNVGGWRLNPRHAITLDDRAIWGTVTCHRCGLDFPILAGAVVTHCALCEGSP